MIRTKLKYKRAVINTRLKAKLNIAPGKLTGVDHSVLCYHGLVHQNPTKYNSRFIAISDFEKHLAFFKEQEDIVVVPLQNIIEQKIVSGKLNLAITFDDGYTNNLKYAVPLLEKYGFPATFCVNNPSTVPLWTDSLDLIFLHYPEVSIQLDRSYTLGKDKSKVRTYLMKNGPAGVQNYLNSVNKVWKELTNDNQLDDYWKRMSDSELESLAANVLFSVIPHGTAHLNLTKLNSQDLLDEIVNSAEFIKDITGDNPNIFCPAFGSYDNHSIDLLKNLGIRHLLAVDKNDYGYLHRLVIHPHIAFEQLRYFFYQGTFT